jgi:Mn-containing catalase
MLESQLLIPFHHFAARAVRRTITYFVQAFTPNLSRQVRPPNGYRDRGIQHLEIVGTTITMILNGVNGDLKNAAEKSSLMNLLKGRG